MDLDPEKVMVNRVKTSPNNVQLLFTDANYTSIIIDTKELLHYLESLTEQVRLVDLKQDPKDL